MRLKTLISALALAALAACAAPDSAERTETVQEVLTVRAIDTANRSFDVTGDGRSFNLRVSDAVVNFDQIEVGDKLNVEFTESIAVSMALPNDTGETITFEGGAAAPEGAKPGAAGVEFVSTVVQFVAYDSRTKKATVTTQDGKIIIATVPRELRSFAAARAPGDLIELDRTSAFAVAITPAG